MNSRGYPPKQGMPGMWQHDLFGCFDNMGLCVMTFCCPCFTFGKVSEAMGENCFICGLLYCLVPGAALMAETVYRQRLKEQNGIEGSLTKDILQLVFCCYCSLCQEAQEIEFMQAMQGGGGPGGVPGGGGGGYGQQRGGYGGQGGYPPPMEMRRH